jgi:hypothetical protein
VWESERSEHAGARGTTEAGGVDHWEQRKGAGERTKQERETRAAARQRAYERHGEAV